MEGEWGGAEGIRRKDRGREVIHCCDGCWKCKRERGKVGLRGYGEQMLEMLGGKQERRGIVGEVWEERTGMGEEKIKERWG